MQKIKNKKKINENNLLAVKNKDKLTIFLRSKFENHRSTLASPFWESLNSGESSQLEGY